MRRDRLFAKLLAKKRILQRAIVAGHRRAHRAPGDAITRLVQAHQRRLQPDALWHQIAFGYVNILHREARSH